MDWLIERFRQDPQRIAFNDEGRSIDYGSLVASVAECRQRLSGSGIRPGASVMLKGDFSPAVFCMMLALAQNHNIIIPLTRHSVIEEGSALAISGCDWHIEPGGATPDFAITQRALGGNSPVLEDFRRTGRPGLVLFSSGSTGTPKAILHDFLLVADKFRQARPPVIAIPFLLLDHFGGINTILAITSSLGTVVTVADRSVASVCRAIERYRVELLPTTPSFLTMLLASGMHHRFDLSSIRRITYGTEVMPQSTLDRLHREFPAVDLQQTYGLSELGVLRSQSRDSDSLWVRLGGQGFETKVVDGCLWIRSEYAMVGYLNAPSEFDADGWFNTQDRVEKDGDHFKILGRATELINVGGQKVYPAEVESVILEMENVQDVAVFGEANALLGQIVVARIVLSRPEPVDALKRRVRKACLKQLANYKAPAKIEIADAPLHNARQKKLRRARPQ